MAKSGKMAKTMKEWGAGELHSGSKQGPVVKSQKQAVAIGLSQARKAGEDVGPAPSKFKGGRGKDRGDK